MNARGYKAGLLIVALLLLVVVGLFQSAINRERDQIGLTRGVGLGSNAPPVLAFTTVALGGFRGLIANALWIRANDLQQDGKYFEMVQLADWITKMEPSLTQVWIVQAWNMAYNISVKFPNPYDRWRWVQRGIELLRDDGLRYNPREALMYRELAWFFQHKMGQNLDDAHKVYKQQWAMEMQALFGSGHPNFPELLNPTTEEARQRVERLVQHYKMDPQLMKEADEQFGPLEWRLPEAHAIYWAYKGLKESKKKDLLTLRRVIYQSMHMEVLHGQLLSIDPFDTGPDLTKIDRANATFEEMLAQEADNPDAIKRPHGNWLREVIYLLYAHNRVQEATKWFNYVRQKYPDAIPPEMTVDDYALRRLAGLDFSRDKIAAVLNGQIEAYFYFMGMGNEDRARGAELFARGLYEIYKKPIAGQEVRLGLLTFDQMKSNKLAAFLDPKNNFDSNFIAALRRNLDLPPQSPPSPEKKSP